MPSKFAIGLGMSPTVDEASRAASIMSTRLASRPEALARMGFGFLTVGVTGFWVRRAGTMDRSGGETSLCTDRMTTGLSAASAAFVTASSARGAAETVTICDGPNPRVARSKARTTNVRLRFIFPPGNFCEASGLPDASEDVKRRQKNFRGAAPDYHAA